jgi:hypothetical protein
MSTARRVAAPARLFPFERWQPLLSELAGQYRRNHPCPHLRLKDFLEPEAAQEMARYLNVHTDFSKHHFHPHWHRRVKTYPLLESAMGCVLGRIARVVGTGAGRRNRALRAKC